MNAKIRETYEKYLPPYIDVPKLVMTFSHVRYCFPSETLLRSMFEKLTAEVKAKNYRAIIQTIEGLEAYRINIKVSDAQKQTVSSSV